MGVSLLIRIGFRYLPLQVGGWKPFNPHLAKILNHAFQCKNNFKSSMQQTSKGS
eukprot:c15978_g1_i1 orf=234-395(+)